MKGSSLREGEVWEGGRDDQTWTGVELVRSEKIEELMRSEEGANGVESSRGLRVGEECRYRDLVILGKEEIVV
jgi:hypothetical protein